MSATNDMGGPLSVRVLSLSVVMNTARRRPYMYTLSAAIRRKTAPWQKVRQMSLSDAFNSNSDVLSAINICAGRKMSTVCSFYTTRGKQRLQAVAHPVCAANATTVGPPGLSSTTFPYRANSSFYPERRMRIKDHLQPRPRALKRTEVTNLKKNFMNQKAIRFNTCTPSFSWCSIFHFLTSFTMLMVTKVQKLKLT